jgi:hypothetical protein
LLRKILITLAISAATLLATTFVDQSDEWALMLSAFVGGVTLVVQFLVDVESGQNSVRVHLGSFAQHQLEMTHQLQASVHDQLQRSSEANSLFSRLDSGPLKRDLVVELVQHAADLHHFVPDLALKLAEAEILAASSFIRELGRGSQVAVDNDGWQWTFTLTDSVKQSIDATSYVAWGGNKETVRDDDMWRSEQSQRYLEAQAKAIQRGVAIRRIFVLETMELADHPDLRQICGQQCQLGIVIRLIDQKTASNIDGSHIPLVIYERNAISFELTPRRFHTESPPHVKTTLVLQTSQVHKRTEMFERLWNGARRYESSSS